MLATDKEFSTYSEYDRFFFFCVSGNVNES